MGGGGQGGVVVPADPAATLEMVKSDTGFQFPVVVFDAPADLREANQGSDRGVGGQVGDPEVGGFGLAVWPFGDQPLFGQCAVVGAGMSRLAGRIRRAVNSERIVAVRLSGPLLVPRRQVTLRRAERPAASTRSLQLVGGSG